MTSDRLILLMAERAANEVINGTQDHGMILPAFGLQPKIACKILYILVMPVTVCGNGYAYCEVIDCREPFERS
jgi:hypothetical protein